MVRLVDWLVLLARSEDAKEAEILVLPRGRRAAPAGRTTQVGLGGQGGARRAGPVAAARAAPPPAGHPGHVARVASSTHRATLAVPQPARATTSAAGDPQARDPARETEPALGVPADPGRRGAARLPGG